MSYHMHVVFDIHEGDEEAMHNASTAVLDALEAEPGLKVVDAMYGETNVCVCEGESEMAFHPLPAERQ